MIKYQHLHQTALFKVSLYLPLILSFIFGFLVFHCNEFKFSFNQKTLDELFNIFKLPITMLGISIPLTALSAAIHRSEQTARQIDSQTSQNNFANHFKHLEEFKNYFKNNKQLHNTIKKYWDDEILFHRIVYPKTTTRDGILSLTPNRQIAPSNEELKDFFEDASSRFLSLDYKVTEFTDHILKTARATGSFTHPISITDLKEIIEAINQAFCFSGFHEKPCRIKPYEGNISIIKTNQETIKKALEKRKPILSKLTTFSNEENFKSYVYELSKIDQNKIEISVIYLWHNTTPDERDRIRKELSTPGKDWLRDATLRFNSGHKDVPSVGQVAEV